MSVIERDYGFTGFLHVSDEELEDARKRKAEHVYSEFVEEVLDGFDSREVFQPSEVQDELRPPYSYGEVKDALEYGAENSDSVDFIEEDMDLFLYLGD